MNEKIQLGQFFTTNHNYILQGLEKYIEDKRVIDPFCGSGELLKWSLVNNCKSILGYDIDKNYIDNKSIFFNDSLNNPKKYEFVLTNPPFLYQNKMNDNSILKNSLHTDLYQLSLEKIIGSQEGIIIVPINFLSAMNSKYIRKIFLYKFEIIKLNYFTTQVFNDTTYNVIAFYYKKKKSNNHKMIIDFNIYPQGIKKEITLYEKYNWQIGGEFLNLISKYKNNLGIYRFEKSHIYSGVNQVNIALNHLDNKKNIFVNDSILYLIKKNIMLLKAIDTGTNEGLIKLENINNYGIEALVSIKTSRNQIYLILPDFINIKQQEFIIKKFNKILSENRDKYYSLFLTNYRDNNRKRISFKFAYSFINYIYFNFIDNEIKDTNDKKEYILF